MSSTSNVEDYAHARSPYLELAIMRAVNMSSFLADIEEIHPYVYISQSNREWASGPGNKHENMYQWGEVFELNIDFNESFTIIIYDQDEFGADTALAGFLVPPHFLNELEESPKDFYLKIQVNSTLSSLTESDDMPVVSAKLLGSEHDECPMLHIQARYIDPDSLCKYSVKIARHKNIVDEKKPYTKYEVIVSRNDGISWKVDLRYSAVYRIRQELVTVMPSLKSQPFPGKTYFDWARVFCRQVSKFNEETISQRKQGIAQFLNLVLERTDTLKSENFNSLLLIPTT